jgi:hypothetical protein
MSDYIVKGREAKVAGGVKKLTERVGGIHGKEKASETEALRDCCSAVHGESPLNGNFVQRRERIL